MDSINHPFIVDFIASFKDQHFLYMVVRLIQGGELFSRIHDVEKEQDGLPEHQAKFYSLCLADAIAYLHRLGYVFRGMSISFFSLPISSLFAQIVVLYLFRSEIGECHD